MPKVAYYKAEVNITYLVIYKYLCVTAVNLTAVTLEILKCQKLSIENHSQYLTV